MSAPLPSSWAGFAPRRWWRIMPVIFVTYSLACLDRVNFGFAAAGGMAAELGLTSGMSSLIGSFFLLGYCAFQIPGAIYAQRRSVKELIFVCMLVWGVCATITGMLSGVGSLLIVRFLLGAAEAAILPAMLVFVSRWFTQAERSRANTFLILGNPTTMLWMSVLSGYLVDAFGWRWMFILEGLPTVIWAFCWWALVQEHPDDAPWLAATEKAELARRLAAEQADLPAVRDYRAALGSRVVLLLAAQYFCWSVGFFGFVLWLPSILRQSSAIGIVQTGWLAALPYLAAIVAMVLVSQVSDRRQVRRGLVWPCLVLAAAAFAALAVVPTDSFWLSFVLLVVAGAAMHAPFGVFWALLPELLPQHVTAGAIALINSLGALGSFFGSYAVGWLHGVTGSAQSSYVLMAATLAVATGLLLAVPRPAKNPA